MTKYKLHLCLLALFTTFSISGQDFNLSALSGYLNIDTTFEFEGESFDFDTASSGFYFGLQSEFNLAEKIDLQPEIVLGIIKDRNALYLSLLGKYNVTENFGLLLGPSFNYVLEDFVDDYQNFGITANIGASYDISDTFFAQAKYSIQLNNYYNGDNDIISRANFLLIGIGYKIL